MQKVKYLHLLQMCKNMCDKSKTSATHQNYNECVFKRNSSFTHHVHFVVIVVKIILGSHDPMTRLYCLFQGLHGLPGLPGPKGDKVSVKLNLIKFILV